MTLRTVTIRVRIDPATTEGAEHYPDTPQGARDLVLDAMRGNYEFWPDEALVSVDGAREERCAV